MSRESSPITRAKRGSKERNGVDVEVPKIVLEGLVDYLTEKHGMELDVWDMGDFLDRRGRRENSSGSLKFERELTLKPSLADSPVEIKCYVGDADDIYEPKCIAFKIGNGKRSTLSWHESISYAREPGNLNSNNSLINKWRYLASVINAELQGAEAVARASFGSSPNLVWWRRRARMLRSVWGEEKVWEFVNDFVQVGATESTFIPVALREDYAKRRRRAERGRKEWW